ncbi:hypothetical protein GYMLUDRAFT_64000 [Collybiopsis luxurians FD-317 M1]|uniref:F-box domain-containing protein n=1 Tax=Collybiopsis luxurians FD-317 M1 TaxID=944289 RepID=A0A0D0BE35_9AGAR|nr:hypothetical protein GYMLUDRAFT_64000 [Collybiopsis luxurians FD-317 M1]
MLSNPSSFAVDQLRAKWQFSKSEASTMVRTVDDEIRTASTEILRLDSDILALQTRRKKLQQLEEWCRSFYSPIHKLSEELLCRVFVLCCGSTPSTFVDSEGRCNLADAPPFVLGSVCKQWRDMTLAAPRLWTNIFLFLDPNNEYDLEAPVGLQLLRSKGYPLTLQIDMDVKHCLDDPNVYREHPLVPILVQNANRWLSVSFTCPQFSKHFFESLSSIGCLSSLEHVEILQTSSLGSLAKDNDLPQLYLLQDAPALRYLSLNRVPRRSSEFSGKFPWKQITHLTLDADNGTVFRALQYCPNLLSVSYTNVHHNRIAPKRKPRHVVPQRSNLRTLSICLSGDEKDTRYNMLKLLISSLTLPRVETISLTTRGSDIVKSLFSGPNPRRQFVEWLKDPEVEVSNLHLFSGTWPRDAFSVFFNRSSRITTLEIKAIPVSDGDLILALDCLPELQNLVIHERPWASESDSYITATHQFLKCLRCPRPAVSTFKVSLQSQGTLVPKLRRLELGVWDLQYFDEVELVGMLTSRWVPDPAHWVDIGVECLHSFRLHISTGKLTEDTHRELEYLRLAGLQVEVFEEAESDDYSEDCGEENEGESEGVMDRVSVASCEV